MGHEFLVVFLWYVTLLLAQLVQLVKPWKIVAEMGHAALEVQTMPVEKIAIRSLQ